MRLEEIAIDLIVPNEGNIRRDVGNVTELAASIKGRGILEPLVVAASEHDHRFSLIAGHRRLAAAQKAKLATVPCRVLDAMSRADELELMLVENLQRSDLTAVEEATAYQQLLTFPDMDVDRIRKATGRSATTIRSRLKLMDLPADAIERVHKGQLSLDAAMKLAQFADEPAQVERLSKMMDNNPHNFVYYLKSAQERAKAMKAATEAGAEVHVDSDAMQTAHPHMERQPWGTKPGPGLVALYDLHSGREASVFKVLDHEPTEDDESEAAERQQKTRHEENRKRDEAREQRRLAQEIRLDYVREQLLQKKLRPAAVLNGFREAVVGRADRTQLLALLDIEWPGGYLSAEDAAAKARPVTDQMELPNLVVLATAAELADSARAALESTQDAWVKAPELRVGVAWFDYLVSLGYELNDIDAAKLAEIEARIALLEGK